MCGLCLCRIFVTTDDLSYHRIFKSICEHISRRTRYIFKRFCFTYFITPTASNTAHAAFSMLHFPGKRATTFHMCFTMHQKCKINRDHHNHRTRGRPNFYKRLAGGTTKISPLQIYRAQNSALRLCAFSELSSKFRRLEHKYS